MPASDALRHKYSSLGPQNWGGKNTNYLGHLLSKELKNLQSNHQTCRRRLQGDTPRPSQHRDGGDPTGAGLRTPSRLVLWPQVAHLSQMETGPSTGLQPPPRDALSAPNASPLKYTPRVSPRIVHPRGHGGGREMPLRFLCS